MNERIEKLAAQARQETNDYFIDDTFDVGAWYIVFQHNFAQLIVRECAAYAFSDEQDHKAMLNHFGVEE